MKTYLDIVNIVLRDLNEVPLTAGTFNSSVGFQSFIKEAVNRALLDVINYNDEWPWLAGTPTSPGISPHTNEFNTTAGVAEYSIAAGVDTVDFDNFYLTVDNHVHKLEFMSFDQMSDHLNTPLSDPKYVYQVPNNNYVGLFPTPDKEYTVKYISWNEPSILQNYDDVLPFPDRYYTVLVSRARYYAWLFRENAQQASLALNEYEDNIRLMYKNLMLPKARVMRAV